MITHMIMLADTLVSQTADNLNKFIGADEGVSRYVATFIMKIVDWILGVFGLEHNEGVVTFLYAVVVFGVAWGVGYIFQWIILKAVTAAAQKWSKGIYATLTANRFFHKACRIIPPLVFLGLIQFTLSNHNGLSVWLTRFTLVYIVLVITMSMCAVVMTVWQRFDARSNKRKLPLGGLAQLVKGILWIIAVIVMIAILADRTPLKLLGGLGAFSAVLMLIFKNNILSLVAGIQLSQDDSLHVGDWITVEGSSANGTVEEVSLVAIKIQNWDKTTTSLPPYNLISSGFTNYRSMQQSNTRRVCRSFMIDADSVLPCTPEMLDRVSRQVPVMAPFITKKLEQAREGKVADVNNPAGLVNGTIDTNLGLFRAYMKMWLDSNPNISHDSDCFVSTLAQTAAGIPLQIYCFTATSGWFPYEGIQDTIFEHIAAMLRYFDLYAFENPSGRDTVIDGYLSAGKDISRVYGIPQPVFLPGQAPAPIQAMTQTSVSNATPASTTTPAEGTTKN